MCSNKLMSFYSNRMKRMKTNQVFALKYRVIKLSHSNYLNDDLNKLRDILIGNSYPPARINRPLFSTAYTVESTVFPTEDVSEKSNLD